ncbi:MAG: hypothetical protein HYR67_11030 [Bacteroidetes bacterium]|nr:hypothetical protein [Bacteroidota bacterium]
MKKVMIVCVMLMSTLAFAQNKVDEERMQRDIEVAENILGTLIKQQAGKRSFFPIEVQGSYLPGYGVTFHLPSEFFGNMFLIEGDGDNWNFEPPIPVEPVVPGEPTHPVKSYSYSYSTSEEKARQEGRNSARGKARTKISRNRGSNSDSSRNAYNEKLLEAAKNFIADYGDLLTQLPSNEKIIITNKGESRNFPMVWAGSGGFEKRKQTILTVEGTKADVNQFRQGKITRDQLVSKLHIMNSEVSDELQPDLELLSSIFNRLYSRDLSRTFFCDDNIYYEKLKDYGAVYHMQVYASSQIDDEGFYNMPTIHLNDVDQQARDKKVKELYPEFEKNIKEDLLEYGRTVKSLKDEEVLTFDVTMTRCKGCAIPSSLELSVKYSVLRDYSSGKISKDAAMAKINIKKGPEQ